jgi:hypothetical protein
VCRAGSGVAELSKCGYASLIPLNAADSALALCLEPRTEFCVVYGFITLNFNTEYLMSHAWF